MCATQSQVGNSLVRVRKAYAIVDELMGSPLGDSVQQECCLTGSARIRCDPVVAGYPYETRLRDSARCPTDGSISRNHARAVA